MYFCLPPGGTSVVSVTRLAITYFFAPMMANVSTAKFAKFHSLFSLGSPFTPHSSSTATPLRMEPFALPRPVHLPVGGCRTRVDLSSVAVCFCSFPLNNLGIMITFTGKLMSITVAHIRVVLFYFVQKLNDFFCLVEVCGAWSSV